MNRVAEIGKALVAGLTTRREVITYRKRGYFQEKKDLSKRAFYIFEEQEVFK